VSGERHGAEGARNVATAWQVPIVDGGRIESGPASQRLYMQDHEAEGDGIFRNAAGVGGSVSNRCGH
jgi:hypothetical protein